MMCECALVFYALFRSYRLVTESHGYINEIWHDGMSLSYSSSCSLVGKTTNGRGNVGGRSDIAATWCNVWEYKYITFGGKKSYLWIPPPSG